MSHISTSVPSAAAVAPNTEGTEDEQEIAHLRRENDQLRDAMSSRAAIEQAKGMLMHGYDLRAEQAFAVLTRWSQTHNIKVRTLAEDMTSHPLTALKEPGTPEAVRGSGTPQ